MPSLATVQKPKPGLEMIGPVPFVTPEDGMELPWFANLQLGQARREVTRQELRFCKHGIEPDYTEIQKIVANVERLIGTTADHIIEATRGQRFNLGPMPDLEARADKRRAALDRSARKAKEPPKVSAYDIRQFDKARRKQADLKTRDSGNKDMRLLAERLHERSETAWRDQAIGETVALNVLRDETIAQYAVKPGETEKPLRRLSGLDWLWSKGRIEAHQMHAGLRYGDDYRLANDISLRSCLAAGIGGSGDDAPQEVKRKAAERLAAAQKAMNHHEGMIDLCDRVAGEGERVRTIAGGDDFAAQKLEGTLNVALDLLATHYGVVA